MNDAQAKKLWAKTLAARRPEERFAFLRRLVAAAPKAVLRLASLGRQRYDVTDDSEGNYAYLYAQKRDGNTLFDGVEVHLASAKRKPKIWFIKTFADMVIGRIPRTFYVKCRWTGQSDIAVGGRSSFLGHVGTGRFIPELEAAIPRLRTYKSWGFTVRCYWTEQEVVEAYGDWLRRFQSQDSQAIRSAIVDYPRFELTKFSDEAQQAVGRYIRPTLAGALKDRDTKVRNSAFFLMREFALTAEDDHSIAAELVESDDPAKRDTGIEHAFLTASSFEEKLRVLERKLDDSDRTLRLSAAKTLRSYGPGGRAPIWDSIAKTVARRLPVETDSEVCDVLSQWYVQHAPIDDATVQTLCRSVEADQPMSVRRFALNRLAQIGAEYPFVSAVAMKYFDTFPALAVNVLLAAKLYSPKAKAKVARLLDHSDWGTRWRAVLYFENCPSVSAKVAKQLSRLRADKEFTVRDAAERVSQRLEMKGRAKPRRESSRRKLVIRAK